MQGCLKFIFVAVLALASAWVPSATAQTNVFASSSSAGVYTFQLGGPSDGSSHGLFISGAPALSPTPGNGYRRIVFGADATGDGTNDLYVGTEFDSIRVFEGTSGAYANTISGTTNYLRQLAVDPANDDLYYGTYSVHKIGRRAADGTAKPGAGQTGDTFVPAVPADSVYSFSVVVGPDGKVYVVNGDGNLQRYSTAGGPAEKTIPSGFDANTGEINFGPDVTGDGLSELYLSQSVTSGKIKVVDVLSDPSSWTIKPDAVTGLNVPIGFAFLDNDMYIAENGDNRISRYRLTGGSWLAAPSTGNSGATFAALADVQDVFIQVPEPSAAALLGLAGLFWLRRRVGR